MGLVLWMVDLMQSVDLRVVLCPYGFFDSTRAEQGRRRLDFLSGRGRLDCVIDTHKRPGSASCFLQYLTIHLYLLYVSFVPNLQR